ncbi:SGNH/GDSL hydrolase family protein [Chitinophaga lutea]
MKHYTWLALGDSYTIGEGVPLHYSYPYQVLQLLRGAGHSFHAPEIIARTAWTSQELIGHLERQQLLPSYDFVTLLIGVNDQYRGLPEAEFAESVEWLTEKALQLTTGLASRVIVLSIPDWGATPFAEGKDVAAAIDRHNAICEDAVRRKGLHYIDITDEYRKTGGLPENLVEDQLHPSANVYRFWAEQLARVMEENI